MTKKRGAESSLDGEKQHCITIWINRTGKLIIIHTPLGAQGFPPLVRLIHKAGILLATFTTSMPQFGLLALPVLVIMNLLSGSTTPMESIPVWLQNVMQVAPSTHFVAFAQAILYRGAGFETVWPDMLVMAGLSAAFFIAALLRFRKTMAATG